MEKHIIIGIVIGGYISGVIACAGFLNASQRAEYRDSLLQDKYMARMFLSVSIMFSLLLPAAALVVLTQQSWKDGWTLDNSPAPCTAQNQDIWCKGNHRS